MMRVPASLDSSREVSASSASPAVFPTDSWSPEDRPVRDPSALGRLGQDGDLDHAQIVAQLGDSRLPHAVDAAIFSCEPPSSDGKLHQLGHVETIRAARAEGPPPALRRSPCGQRAAGRVKRIDETENAHASTAAIICCAMSSPSARTENAPLWSGETRVLMIVPSPRLTRQKLAARDGARCAGTSSLLTPAGQREGSGASQATARTRLRLLFSMRSRSFPATTSLRRSRQRCAPLSTASGDA